MPSDNELRTAFKAALTDYKAALVRLENAEAALKGSYGTPSAEDMIEHSAAKGVVSFYRTPVEVLFSRLTGLMIHEFESYFVGNQNAA